jgi:hypothetical protein
MHAEWIKNSQGRSVKIEGRIFHRYSNLPNNMALFVTDIEPCDDEQEVTVAMIDRGDGEVFVIYTVYGRDLSTRTHTP